MSRTSRSGSETDGEAQPAATTADRRPKVRLRRGYPKKLEVLQTKLDSLTVRAGQLVSEQQQLREREEVLYASIQEQGDYVHDIVVLLAQQQQQQQGVPASQPLQGTCSCDCSAREEQVLDALSQSAINDLRIQHALLLLGKGQPATQANGSSGSRRSAGELRSTACLRAAVTADNIAWARSATLAEVTAEYRSRIMRVAFLLAHPAKQGLADSIDAIVSNVITTHMLLFAAADKLVLQLALVNCDTGQQAAASPHHFRQVAAALELSQEQQQLLRSAFQVYTTRRAALIAKLQPLAQQISALLNKGCSCCCHAHPPTIPPPPASVTGPAADTAAGSNPGAGSSRAGGVSSARCCSCAGGAPAAAAACLSLEEAEQLAALLGAYESLVVQCRLLGRSLSWFWLNTLSSRQLALAAVAAYPMYLQPIQICAAI